VKQHPLSGFLGSGAALTLHRNVIQALGGLELAAFFEQMVYIANRGDHKTSEYEVREGFVVMPQTQWVLEVYATEYSMSRMPGQLQQMGIIEIKKFRVQRGESFVNLAGYKPNLEQLVALLDEAANKSKQEGSADSDSVKTRSQSNGQNAESDSVKTRSLPISRVIKDLKAEGGGSDVDYNDPPEDPTTGQAPENESVKAQYNLVKLDGVQRHFFGQLKGDVTIIRARNTILAAGVEMFVKLLDIRELADAKPPTFRQMVQELAEHIQERGPDYVLECMKITLGKPLDKPRGAFDFYKAVLRSERFERKPFVPEGLVSANPAPKNDLPMCDSRGIWANEMGFQFEVLDVDGSTVILGDGDLMPQIETRGWTKVGAS
jgi:hypothetical protein